MGLFGTRSIPSPANTDRSAGFAAGASMVAPVGAADTTFQLDPVSALAAVALWFKFDFTPVHGTYYPILRAGNFSIPSDGWALQYDGTLNAISFAYSNGTSYQNVGGQLDPVAGQWYFVVAGPGGGSTIYLDVWDTTHQLVGGSAGVTGPIHTAVPPPALHVNPVVAGDSQFNGEIDSLGFWRSRILTNAELTALWNNGQGLRYQGGGVAAANGGSLLNGLGAWYDFDDRSGSPAWRDRVGTHDLQATGLVFSRPPRGM